MKKLFPCFDQHCDKEFLSVTAREAHFRIVHREQLKQALRELLLEEK